MGMITTKIAMITARWGDKGASRISRLLGAAKLQSVSGVDNPRNAAVPRAVVKEIWKFRRGVGI